MLEVQNDGDIDYNRLTNTYMGIFHTQKFAEFLNTSQVGYAHSASGLEFSLLLKSLGTSLFLCGFQISLFCVFRTLFKVLYQPRSYCVPISERMQPLPKGFLKWVFPTLSYSINYYLSMGLDAYFFIRYISILLLFFSLVGSLNMLVLIPINWTGHTEDYMASGLDKLSLSNIAKSKIKRLNAHFLMCLLTVSFFHWIITYEFHSFVKIKQSYLLSKVHEETATAKILLVSNVPSYLREPDILRHLFEVIPGGVENIWFLYDFRGIYEDIKEAREALDILEKADIAYVKTILSCVQPRKPNFGFWNNLKKKSPEIEDNAVMKLDGNKLAPKFYPPVYFKLIKIPKIERYLRLKLPGFLRIFLLEKPVNTVEWCLDTLLNKHNAIDLEKVRMVSGQLKKHNKIFLEFRTQTAAYMAHQCLLSQSQGALDLTLIDMHPDDILWNNVGRNHSFACLVERYIVTLIFICIMILYVIPVSFIGLVSQIPLLTRLIPSLGWISKLPKEFRKILSSILPSIGLVLLTDIVLVVFRFLTYFKGFLSGAELEIDMQKWYFAFLFIQQFLIVTILSSITVVFKQIVDKPMSIPILLATNLPKAANFFFQYIALKAFSFCGNNFLRIGALIKHLTFYKLVDAPPRQKFNRVATLVRIQWGSVYPVYSVFASIGLSYCIISPLIAVFVIFILSLLLLYYKYALRFFYSHINPSDTKGRHYPLALLHLYAGLYCLECCLIGIFFLLRDQYDNSPMVMQGWFMIIVLIATIFGNITIYRRYVKHFAYLPILSDKKFKHVEARKAIPKENNEAPEEESPKETNDAKEVDDMYLNHHMLFSHPAFKYEKPTLWLPEDPFQLSRLLIEEQTKFPNALQSGSTEGAQLNVSSTGFKVVITNAPPDYK